MILKMLGIALRKLSRIPSFLSRVVQGKLGRKNLLTLQRHDTYEDYVGKQVKKTNDAARIKKWQNKEWDSKVEGFIGIFSNLNIDLANKPALCLGSRTGQEVHALQFLGAPAKGIDLVAFPPYTEVGDVHALTFDDETFSLVFTNIFDHVLYPEKFAREASRVLAPKGLLVIRAQLGFRGDDFSETFITSKDPLIQLFSHLELVDSQELRDQFDGMDVQLVFSKP